MQMQSATNEWVLHINQEPIFIGEPFGGEQVPDPLWRFIDRKGHLHAWVDKELPTLKSVESGEYYDYDDPIYHWICRKCGQVIRPEKKMEPAPRYIPGYIEVRVEWWDGLIMPISPEKWAKIQEDIGEEVKALHTELLSDFFTKLRDSGKYESVSTNIL